MNKQLIPILLAFSLFLVSGCQSPASLSTSASQSGTVKISLTTHARAVVANWTNIVTSYVLNLHCTNRTVPDLSQTVSQAAGSTGVVFSPVNVGTWNISVTALGARGAVGAGSATGQVLSANSPLNVSIPISDTQTGTGTFSFTFTFPATAGTTGADYVSAQLFNLSNAPVGASFVPTLTATTSWQATVTQTVPSGNYRLELTFRRGGAAGAIAGIYGEGVTVWDNVTSDQWLNSQGILVSTKTFAVGDFNDSNASLSDLTATAGGESTALAPPFSSSTLTYILSQTGVTFSPVQSLDGQRIQYQLNGSGSWTDIASGSSTASLSTGAKIDFRVTAADLNTTKTYSVSLVSGATASWSGPITMPVANSVEIAGQAKLYRGTSYTFSTVYSGGLSISSTYSWYLDDATLTPLLTGDLVAACSLPVNGLPSGPWSVGHHVLIVIIKDANGLFYSGSLPVTVDPTYPIGSIGPAGGIVFYDQGQVVSGWRYLEVATSDQSISAPFFVVNVPEPPQANALGKGGGDILTTNLIAHQATNGITNLGSFAAGICRSYVNPLQSAYHDWYLPTTAELQAIHNSTAAGNINMASAEYWSSEGNTTNGGWVFDFSAIPAVSVNQLGTNPYHVRAIRAF